jgi:hypothetical protein
VNLAPKARRQRDRREASAAIADVDGAYRRRREPVPAYTRWLLLEPLLEPVKFSRPDLLFAPLSVASERWTPLMSRDNDEGGSL